MTVQAVKRLNRRRQRKLPDSPSCAAPGCPMRWDHVTNHGQGYCRWHFDAQGADRVSEITRRLHRLKPVFKQIRTLYSLHAGQLMGECDIPIEDGLPAVCMRMEDEPITLWTHRLRRYVDAEMKL